MSPALKQKITQMDAFLSPFLPPFYSNLAVPSGTQKANVLILSRLFPVGSHYIHACLCLPQMVQMPRQPKAHTWQDAGHSCSTQGSACCISDTECVPWAVPGTRLAQGCDTAGIQQTGHQRRKLRGVPGGLKVPLCLHSVSPALCTLPQQQQCSWGVLLPDPGHICIATQSHQAPIWSQC